MSEQSENCPSCKEIWAAKMTKTTGGRTYTCAGCGEPIFTFNSTGHFTVATGPTDDRDYDKLHATYLKACETIKQWKAAEQQLIESQAQHEANVAQAKEWIADAKLLEYRARRAEDERSSLYKLLEHICRGNSIRVPGDDGEWVTISKDKLDELLKGDG